MANNNPPLDFQQNPVEFVMDALRVARATAKGWFAVDDLVQYRGSHGNPITEKDAAFIAKFDPPFTIALMEDWLRLRERNEALYIIQQTNDRLLTAMESIRNCPDGCGLCREKARTALAKQG